MLDGQYYKSINENFLNEANKYFRDRIYDIPIMDGKEVEKTIIPDNIRNAFFNENVSIISNDSFDKALYNAFLKSPMYDVKMYESGRNLIHNTLSNFAQSVEAKNMLLDYIYQGKPFSSEEFLRVNAKAFEGKTVSHGLNINVLDGFGLEEFNNNNKNEKVSIRERLNNIKNNKNIELATSSENYALGDIGIFGKAKNAKYAYKEDLLSYVENGVRLHGKGPRTILQNLKSSLDNFEGYYETNNIKKLSRNFNLPNRFDEIITQIDEIDSLWVKKSYFDNNKDFVTSLMKEFDIKNLDIIHADKEIQNIQKYKIERFSYDDLPIEKENIKLNISQKNLLKDILQPDLHLKREKRYGYYDVETFRENFYKEISRSDKTFANNKINGEFDPITIRYHANKDHIFAIDNTKLGTNIKIQSFGDNFGHTGTWSSPRIIPGEETAWLKNAHEWIKTDKNNNYTGYMSVFKFKDDAKVLKISNEDNIIDLINNFGTENSKRKIISILDNIDSDTESSLMLDWDNELNSRKSKLAHEIQENIEINWDEISKQYDAVRIRTTSFTTEKGIPYSNIVHDYYGDTDVIFNKSSVDVLKTMPIDQYYKDLDEEYKSGIFTNYEAKQTAEDIKDILIPPNWKNRNINEEYTNLISKYAGTYDKITNESALFKFIQKEDAIKTSNIFTGIAENTGMHLFINHENTILDVHGEKSGEIYYKGFDFKINEIIDTLEEAGLIPEGTKQIYTMSCYGGLQEKGLSANGIPFESIHTAKDKVDITDANKIKEKIENYKQTIKDSKDEQIIEQYKNLKDHENIIALKVNKTDPYGKISEKFKINTLTQYEKYGEHFADTELVDQEAIDKALWPKLKEKIRDKINSFENNDDPLKAQYEQWYKRLEGKYKPQYLTAQEAFDKYGPDDDRFYISQGLDPIEQRQKINKLNTNKLSNQEILDHVHEQTQDAERQFIKTANDLGQDIQEANRLRDRIEQGLKELEQEELEEIKNNKPEIKIDFEETLEKTAKETAENTQLTTKTIQNTAKNALNTKGLGIAIAAGATVAIAGIAGIIAGSHKKDDDEDEKENKKQTKNNKKHAINTVQYSQMDYNNNLAYANQITSFSRGHSTYSLG